MHHPVAQSDEAWRAELNSVFVRCLVNNDASAGAFQFLADPHEVRLVLGDIEALRQGKLEAKTLSNGIGNIVVLRSAKHIHDALAFHFIEPLLVDLFLRVEQLDPRGDVGGTDFDVTLWRRPKVFSGFGRGLHQARIDVDLNDVLVFLEHV